jgi:hypothetical protein
MSHVIFINSFHADYRRLNNESNKIETKKKRVKNEPLGLTDWNKKIIIQYQEQLHLYS